ncbi:hypothetical protein [Ruminiclostridium sufflavum]|nr:hypothetical protein [Ruminiclostridium sufflavum]
MDINMKKFIIVIVFVFLIAILISFNYLLWDREKQIESYQNMKQSNNLTIDTLSEKMTNLDKLNKELATKVETLTNDNEAMRQHSTKLNNENAELRKEISARKALIIALKKTLNISPMNMVIKKWTEAIAARNYESALNFISKDTSDKTLPKDVKELKELYYNEIKDIKLKAAEPYIELTDEEHIKKIQLKAVFEVVKPESTEDNKVTQNIFVNGTNEKYITMELNLYSGEWQILELKGEP